MKRLFQISGGYDSAAALVHMLHEYPDDEAVLLQVNYGQAYLRQELAAVQYLINQIAKVRDLTYIFANCDMAIGEMSTKGQTVAQHYVPVRNAVIGALSLNYAVAIGAKEIVVGMKRDFTPIPDPFFYRDSGGTFYAVMNALASTCVEFRDFPAPRFVAPLNRNGNPYTKTECMKLLIDAGLDPLKLWSCSSADERCKQCHMCEGVQKALAPLGRSL